MSQSFQLPQLSACFFMLFLALAFSPGVQANHRISHGASNKEGAETCPHHAGHTSETSRDSDLKTQKIADFFLKTPKLTAQQKEKLIEIASRTETEARIIRSEIEESKILLFQTLAQVDYESKDIEVIRKKLVALDQKRLEQMFKALSQVQQIVGFGKDREDFYKKLQEQESFQGRVLSSQP